MKVDGSLGSLLQGVSLQTARDRFDGQATLQENMSSDPVNGLVRRPPTDLVGYLGSSASILGWHNFHTRNGNKFLAMFKPGDVDVYDLNADAHTVTVDANAVAYLATTENMKCATDDEDTTVVVNPSVTVAMSASPTAYINTGTSGAALFQVLGGAYGKEYTISINGTQHASYQTNNGSTASDAPYITTSHIAMRLLQALTVGGVWTGTDGTGSGFNGSGALGGGGWTYSRVGDIIRIHQTVGQFDISVSDGAGGVNLKGATDTVPKISDLPRFAPHYYAIRIAENSEKEKDLWFKFIVSALEGTTTPDSSVFGKSGYWTEAVAPNTDTAFSPATMPHKLMYNNPNFTFSREAYDARKVGTTVSNPDPSFVGNTINDVSAFQGRAVFLSGSSVIMSRTNKPTNFWQGSASALVDTDPIDINSTVESSQMFSVLEHNKDLVAFSAKAQHVVFGRSAITPANAALVMTTRFESEHEAKPVGSGKNVFFAYNFGRFTGIREFFAEGASDSNDSRPITQHVNKYILGKARLLTASANYDTLLVHTDAAQSDTFVYQYIWNGQEKVQSAWSTWKFKNAVVYSFFDEDLLYYVQRRGTDYYLLRMPLDVQDSDGVGYPVYLDQRFDVLDCYNSFELPFDYLADEELVCVQGENCPTPGLTVTIDSIVDGVVTLKTNMLGGDLVVGVRYSSKYRPTMPSMKDQNGVVIGTSKLRARAFMVALDQTGEITGQVLSPYGDGEQITFNARIVGAIDNVIGEQPLSDGTFTMPFRQNVNDAEIELSTDSHLPMGLADIEYVGQYNKRGRRIANTGGKQ